MTNEEIITALNRSDLAAEVTIPIEMWKELLEEILELRKIRNRLEVVR